MTTTKFSSLHRILLSCLAGAASVSLLSAKAEAAYIFQSANFPNDNFTQLRLFRAFGEPVTTQENDDSRKPLTELRSSVC